MIRPATPADVPANIADRVQSELQPGEILVWAGQPDPDLAVRGAWILSIFGLVFLIPPLFFLSLTTFGVFALGNLGLIGLCFLPGGLVFAVVGLFLVLTPMRIRRAARKGIYAITSQRAIVWRKTMFSMTIQSFGPDQLGRMYRKERPNGAGDLVFYDSAWANTDGSRQIQTIGFLAIRDVHQVEELVRATLLQPHP